MKVAYIPNLYHKSFVIDFTSGCYGKGLYFSQSPRKAMEFSTVDMTLMFLYFFNVTA